MPLCGCVAGCSCAETGARLRARLQQKGLENDNSDWVYLE